ncbi:hypothetical protein WR25_21890 [Diploscapter pachys]|uniref:Nematode cuticle collagen N-terminal domain-containing protein n=1 Tax=Diploscapter pachys TaxID=2018661 RepID=A0A2A2LBS1_9BILA|nr:hypothetical protein WR25_21890 [Diploscapter pachys]
MMDLEGRIKAYRFVAYAAVTFSVVAVLSVCITLPMVYSYVKHVKSSLNTEIHFCKDSAKDIWSEVSHLKDMPTATQNRTIRQSGYGETSNSYGETTSRPAPATSTSASMCQGCCQPGVPGKPGKPGKNGAPGLPGNPGKPPQLPCDSLMTPPPCKSLNVKS